MEAAMKNSEFVADNYIKEELTFKTGREMIFAFFVVIISGLVFGIPFYLLWSEKIQIAFNNTEVDFQSRLIAVGVFLGIIIIGLIVHELIHGFFFALFCKNKFKSIKFGIALKKGYAYCKCKEILRANQYVVSLLMPTIILGIIPSIGSLFIGNSDLLLFGVIFVGAGGSDILIFKKIAKEIKGSWLEEDLLNDEVLYIYKPNIRTKYRIKI
jgi:hypothetical protein